MWPTAYSVSERYFVKRYNSWILIWQHCAPYWIGHVGLTVFCFSLRIRKIGSALYLDNDSNCEYIKFKIRVGYSRLLVLEIRSLEICFKNARVAELVDARDLKSLGP